MKRKPLLIISVGVLLTVSLIATVVAITKKPYRSGDVIEGRRSKVTSHEYHLITVEKQWKGIWNRHSGAKTTVPAIDFSRHMVVGIFLGKTSQCTGIDVQSVGRNKKDGQLDIRYVPAWYSATVDSPDDHDATPFGFVIIERAAGVSVFEDVQFVRGAPPKYELRAQLSAKAPVVKH